MEKEKLVTRLLDTIPKDSIARYDLFPVFKEPELFNEISRSLSAPYAGKIDYVAAPEAIGWILGTAIAKELNVGFVPLRKIDKLPYPKEILISQNYITHPDKDKALEIKQGHVTAGDKLLIVDEWVETGVSMRCCINLLEKLGCVIVGLATIGIDYREETKDWIDTGFIQYIGKNI